MANDAELEEFEFRLRLEQESAAPSAPKAAAKPTESALSFIGREAKSSLQNIGNLAAGMVRGAGSIGATLLAPADMLDDYLMGDRGPNITGLVTGKQPISRNQERRQAMDEGLRSMGAEPDSLLYQGGKIGAEVAGVAGAGPALGATSKALGAGQSVVNALTTGGMRAGSTPGGMNMLARIGGGAATGAASAGLIDPEYAAAGAGIGAALPPALAGAGRAAGYAGRAAGSVVKPFTATGQDEIASGVIRRFAEGGPTNLNARQIIPGSSPTLAEATGNAGLATLQRGTRDLRPNAFVERETQNAAARLAAFDDVAGDAGKLDFFKASRSDAAGDLYGEALNQVNAQPVTPYVKGQITQLLKRPSIDEASRIAQRLARERGEKPAAAGSLRALHDVKTALDDKIGEAVRAGKGGEAKALGETKDKLLDVMEKLSPEYGQARVTYAEMSKPINAMETLQGLKLTDAQGNITLAKVQNAIRSIENARSAPGANPAKSLADDQINTLTAIRDDLLRQSNLGAGRSIGSNTFQNLATDNILNSMAGNTISRLADRVGVAGVLGQVGRLAYSGPNEAIRNRLVDMMLSPQLATNALSGRPLVSAPNALVRLASDPRVQQPLYRSAPALSSSQ